MTNHGLLKLRVKSLNCDFCTYDMSVYKIKLSLCNLRFPQFYYM